MISFYAHAQYVGQDQQLRTGGNYDIEIWQDWRGRYCVGITHGYYRKPVQGYVFKYLTLRQLLANWRDIEPMSLFKVKNT